MTTVDALWMCILSLFVLREQNGWTCDMFCVRPLRCPFNSNGHTRASERGTDNRYRPSRFFYISGFADEWVRRQID